MKRALALILAATLISAVGCNKEKEAMEPAETEPAGNPQKNESAPQEDEAFVGLPVGEAETLAERKGLKHRIVERDGQLLPATRDYRPDRINFHVVEGKVVKTSRG